MELHFVSPVLAELDVLESEVLVCSLWQDVWPCDGVAGLCDWRFAGGLSRLQRDGFLSGRLGEVMMLPGRPRMSFEKILIFGAGPRVQFDEACYLTVLKSMMETVERLCARVTVAQLPGRQSGLITAERAADLLLEATTRGDSRGRYDAWTLVEDAEARRRIEQHMIEERRRIRRIR